MTQRILIVEDDLPLAAGLTRALSLEDRKIQSCSKLQEAERLIREEAPELVLLDVNLPDGNGYDFLAKLRKTSQIPVILPVSYTHLKIFS